MKRMTLALLALAVATAADAKLPDPSPEASAKADLAKAENAHKDKVAAYQLCQSQNGVAKRYLANSAGKGKGAAGAPPCADPGPFVPPPAPMAATPPAAADAKK